MALGLRDVQKLRVGFLLAPDFTLCAFANFIDVLRLASDEGDRSRGIDCSWKVLAQTERSVRSSCGVSVQPQSRLVDPKSLDYLVIVGGLTEGLGRFSDANKRYIRRAASSGVHLVGICTGAFLLCDLGLMNNRKACVSWFHHEEFKRAYPDVDFVSDQIFVVDRDRFTCGGGTSSAHLAAFLVDRHLNEAKAQKSLRIMMFDRMAPGHRHQPFRWDEFSSGDDLVNRAIVIIKDAIDNPPTTKELAKSLGVSARQLRRRFLLSLGLSPMELKRKYRHDQTCHLLRKSQQSVSQIAATLGYSDASHLTSDFKSETGTTPKAWRENLTPHIGAH